MGAGEREIRGDIPGLSVQDLEDKYKFRGKNDLKFDDLPAVVGECDS